MTDANSLMTRKNLHENFSKSKISTQAEEGQQIRLTCKRKLSLRFVTTVQAGLFSGCLGLYVTPQSYMVIPLN